MWFHNNDINEALQNYYQFCDVVQMTIIDKKAY
jgi:hypothetical protein